MIVLYVLLILVLVVGPTISPSRVYAALSRVLMKPGAVIAMRNPCPACTAGINAWNNAHAQHQ